MIDKKIEEKLKNLRELYLEKRSDKESDQKVQEFDTFTTLNTEEKEHKLLHQLELINQKLSQLNVRLTSLKAEKASKTELSELKYYIDNVKTKKVILEQKLEFIQSGELDATRKEKVKRQLTELELKRCKALLNKKDCSKIDEKIALKKEAIKRLK